MNPIVRDGCTLLLVSHTGKLLEDTCQRCIYLEGGRVEYDGERAEAVLRYERAPVA